VGHVLARFYLEVFGVIVMVLLFIFAVLYLPLCRALVCRAWWRGAHDFEAADGTQTLHDCSRCGAKNNKAGFD